MRKRHSPQRAALSLLSIALFATCAAHAQGDAHADEKVEDGELRLLTPMQQAERLRADRQYVDALAIYERVLAADPGDRGAYAMRALTLDDLHSPQLAWEAVQRHPEGFSTAERERIDNDRLASIISEGDAPPVDPAHRLAETDRALSQIAATDHDAPRQTHWEATRLRVDTLIALNRRQRHAEVVARYQALRDDGIDVPAYALPVVADSMMALRRPEQAEPLLRQALAEGHDDVSTRLLLGWSLLEQERFDEALPLFEQLAAQQPPWPRREGAHSGYENWDRFSADLALASARAAAQDTHGAERLLRALERIAPANAELQAALAAQEANRGWPQAALQRDRVALTLDPTQKDARVGVVENERALRRPDRAEAAMAPLRAEYPDDPGLARLDDTLSRDRGWQVHAASRYGDSDGGHSPVGSRDGGTLLEAESPLIGDRWRVGLRAQEDWAELPGERVERRSLALGAHYRYDRLDVAAYAGRTLDDFGRDDPTASLEAEWRFSDAWTATFAATQQDPDASLQARRLGIHADGVMAGLRWTPSDDSRWTLQARQLRYDDGNRRQTLDLSGLQRLWAAPHLRLDGLLWASAGRAADDRPVDYYNPRRDASLSLGLGLEQIGWRRYGHAFRQRVEIAAGPAYQWGYGTHWVPSLAYRHLWSLGDGQALEYGVRWSQPVYDGERERYLSFDIDYRWGGAP